MTWKNNASAPNRVAGTGRMTELMSRLFMLYCFGFRLDPLRVLGLSGLSWVSGMAKRVGALKYVWLQFLVISQFPTHTQTSQWKSKHTNIGCHGRNTAFNNAKIQGKWAPWIKRKFILPVWASCMDGSIHATDFMCGVLQGGNVFEGSPSFMYICVVYPI